MNRQTTPCVGCARPVPWPNRLGTPIRHCAKCRQKLEPRHKPRHAICQQCGKRFPIKSFGKIGRTATYCGVECRHSASLAARRVKGSYSKCRRVLEATGKLCGRVIEETSKTGRPRGVCDECRK